MDLQDESYYVLVPWRWALGDKPFVHEQNLAQVAGFLEYPFIKLFGLVRGYDVTGLVLYTRHLYLLLMVLVAMVVFLALRKLVRWQLALLVATVYVSYIFWETPQLSYKTLAAAFLSLSAAIGIWVVLEQRGRAWALASGVAYALAVVAYPTLVFIVPFVAVFMALSLGERSVGMIADRSLGMPREERHAQTGRMAWTSLISWVLGGAVVLVPYVMFLLSFGTKTLWRCWIYTTEVAKRLDQLGGAEKAVGVFRGVYRFIWSAPYLLVAALVIYLVYLRWPRFGRTLLVFLPIALWAAGQRALFDSAGFALIYALLAPYLYLFVPHRHRHSGAVLLFWLWVPALIAGAMTAFTSAAGYVNAPIGLSPALMASGLFLAWALEAAGVGDHVKEIDTSGPDTPRPWLALAVLSAIVAVTVVFQFQFQQRDVRLAELNRCCDFGPWWGISVRPERYDQLKEFATDLHAEAKPGDSLLIFYESCGYYLFWNGEIAANSYWLSSEDALAPLHQDTITYYHRHRIVPTLAVHLLATDGITDAELTETCGGLGYPPVLVRPSCAFHRRPADESTSEVLARLPRD